MTEYSKCPNCGTQATSAVHTGVGVRRALKYSCLSAWCGGYSWSASKCRQEYHRDAAALAGMQDTGEL